MFFKNQKTKKILTLSLLIFWGAFFVGLVGVNNVWGQTQEEAGIYDGISISAAFKGLGDFGKKLLAQWVVGF